jgi:signal transduction histidine kinase/ligand-binding sensor domain-containing protein
MHRKNGFIICRIIILFSFLLLFSSSYAQLSTDNFTQFTEKEGFPGPESAAILKDRLGYIWAGTVNGLTRYDGYEFKRFYYDPNDSATVHGLIIWSLFEDRKGLIWVGSSPGYLNAYNAATKKFRQYRFGHLVPHRTSVELVIRCMNEDNNGRMYFGIDTYYGDQVTTTILYKDENEDSVKGFVVPDSLKIQNVYRIKKDNAGNMWFLSSTGCFKIDTTRKLSRFAYLDNEFIRNGDYPGDMLFDKNNHLWMISQQLKLYDVDTKSGLFNMWKANNLPDKKNTISDNNFFFIPRKMTLDNDGNIWIGTSNGVHFFNSTTKEFFLFNTGTKKELEHSIIVDMCFDSFGTLWLATLRDGLIKYEKRSLLKSYSYDKNNRNSLTSGWADHIFEASDGRIWITTSGSSVYSGINILDPRTGMLRTLPYDRIQKRINGFSAIWENKPGEMYVSANNTLYSFSEETLALKPVHLPGIPDTIYTTYFLKDKKNKEWFFGFGSIYRRDKPGDTFIKIDLSQIKGSDASSNQVTRAIEGKYGLWLLTNNGLFLYNYASDKIERHGFDKSAGDIFVTQDINSLYEDPQGIVWVGTWAGGLSRYNVEAKKIKTYTRNDGLPSMSIQGIVADEKNNSLWLSTFEGISRMNLKTEQFNNFSIADGIQSQLFADGSYLKSSSGLIAFGGSNGITIFNPDDVTKSSIPPKVFLTEFKVADKPIIPGENAILKRPIYETGEVTLAHSNNNLSIEFTALHYSNPSKNRYSYKLDNYENEWRDVGSQHVAFYPNLPAGEYIFHVKAANDKGVWNEQGATLKIIINPPWWRTIWAYVLYGVLLLCAGLAVDRYLRRRVVKKEREKTRARELAQAKEIEKAYHELKETQQQLIQAEKMASLGELTAGIAHEIQNPLNFVNNFSEINKELIGELKKFKSNPDSYREKSEELDSLLDDIADNENKINHHGRRADAIVKNMLQHSRTGTGQKEPADINALCDEYLRLAYHGLRAKDNSFNATLKTDFDKSIGNIPVIAQDIGRVVLNLVNNAFYAIHEKKKANPGNYEPSLLISTKKTGNKILISIADNGNGIPQKILDKIFQPFFTTKPTGQGTGLGLSLSYDIIKAHSGEIKAESKEGEGTTFTISIPSSL